MRIPSLALGVLIGACAGTAATTVATSSPPASAPPAAGALAPAVVAAGSHEVRIAPSGKARITLLARGHNAFLGKLEMDGGGRVPEHRDPTEEFLYVLEGAGTLMIDDVRYEVGPGTSIYMPAEAKVSYENGGAPLVAVQVFADPSPASKYDAWTPAASAPQAP